MPNTDPRYPIGPFQKPTRPLTEPERRRFIEQIADLPSQLRAAVKNLDKNQIDTPYRDGGWTSRQVAHHLADSHMNSYTRFRLALTEQNPTIKPYDEAKWAELADAKSADPEISLAILDPLHVRWVMLLQSMKDADFKRKFLHPEMGEVPLDMALALYAWHGRHHVAHITTLREKMGWK